MKKVLWTDEAMAGQQEIVDYILDRFDVTAALNFQEKVEKAESLIANNPAIMPLDQNVRNSTLPVRSIVIGKYSKMLYAEYNEQIVILDFWDVRQEPGPHYDI